jgi:acetylornithine/N-succinyldiaminopimelate aminotransferase
MNFMQNNPPLLAAEALALDSRVAKAKSLLVDAVKSHQSHLSGIRPPNPQLRQKYQDLLAAFSECRGGKLWFPYLGSGIGNGVFVELLDGSVKYDFISGIGPQVLGHSHPNLVEAGVDAAISDLVMQGNLQQNGDALELSIHLCRVSGMDHCFLTSSGAMANENALKIAFQKRFPAKRILAFEGCFAGRTLALSQITDKPSYREGMPLTISVDYIPFFDPENPEVSTERALKKLKTHLSRYPKEHAAMCFELVQGERGFYVGEKDFFIKIMQVLKDHQVSIWIDEVQTFGRTPQLFAFQYFGLNEYADIVTIGKLSQVCATLFNSTHRPRPGLLSQTFTSSTSAIRAAKTILNELQHGDYFGPEGKIVKVYDYFSKKLMEIAQRHPELVKGPFGIGTMIAVTPYDGETKQVTQFVHNLFDAGVISFIAGLYPTRVRFLVPTGVLRFEDIDEVARIFEKVLLETK